MEWYRLEVRIDEKPVTVLCFQSWEAANKAADTLEKEDPEANVQLWVRER